MSIDKKVIGEKLLSLNRCLERVKLHTPANVEALQSDFDTQDIICLNIQRAVQISVDIAAHILAEQLHEQTPTMAETFLTLSKYGILESQLASRLAKAVGFRNIAVHEYNTLDMNILYSIITQEIDYFYEFSDTVLRIVS
ncbi:MAG: type VII toxin-antitoxin system HepT family RNase toxin [Treponema sp.]